jgi:hypothetical protein
LQNQNGLLYVEVPDAARYDKFFKAPFHFFDVEHINHFDMASLSNLGHLGGYKAVTSGSKELGVSDNELYPAIFTVFEKTFSSAAHSSIVKYIELSNKNLEDENMLIADLVTSQKEVIVFGVGSYTRRMLATADLSKCNIVCFVDNDTSKQGQECAGKKINSADVIKNFSGTVVICSAIHSLEIERQVSEINPNIPRVVMR